MRFTRLLVISALLLPACAQRPGEGQAAAGPDPQIQRQVGVYVAVLRELTGDAAGDAAATVYVLDRAVPDAAEPGVTDEEGKAIPPEVQQGVLDAFTGHDLRFIADGDEVTVPLEEGTGGGVEGGGSLITLGPIPEGSSRVEVAAGSYCGGLCGMWATYVVQLRGTVWNVTGTTGPVAIS